MIGHAIAALLLFFATQKRAQIYDRVFMISMVLQAAGWFLLFYRGIISDILSFSFGNTLIFCGFCLESIALFSLVRPMGKRWLKFFAAVLALSLIIIWLPLSGQDQKVGMVSFVIPFFFLFPGIFLVYSAPRPSPLKQFIGGILILYITAVLARGVYLLIAKASVPGINKSSSPGVLGSIPVWGSSSPGRSWQSPVSPSPRLASRERGPGLR